jgi:ABC-type uncharacterized transport system permease subunit
VRAYAHFARCAFQRRAAYRLANWSGITVNFFFFFLIHAQVFFAFFGARPSMVGWSAEDAVRYFATSEALLMVFGLMSTGAAADLPSAFAAATSPSIWRDPCGCGPAS